MLDPESAYRDKRASAIREETEDEEQESTNTLSSPYKDQVKIIKSKDRYQQYDNNVVTDDAKMLKEKDLYSDEDHKAE